MLLLAHSFGISCCWSSNDSTQMDINDDDDILRQHLILYSTPSPLTCLLKHHHNSWIWIAGTKSSVDHCKYKNNLLFKFIALTNPISPLTNPLSVWICILVQQLNWTLGTCSLVLSLNNAAGNVCWLIGDRVFANDPSITLCANYCGPRTTTLTTNYITCIGGVLLWLHGLLHIWTNFNDLTTIACVLWSVWNANANTAIINWGTAR